jgi:hypothetical protein
MTKKEYNRRYYLLHREALCAAQRQYTKRNKAVILVKDRARYKIRRLAMLKQKHEHYPQVRERKLAYNRRYNVENRASIQAQKRLYRKLLRKLGVDLLGVRRKY